jgi:hypothetical protein
VKRGMRISNPPGSHHDVPARLASPVTTDQHRVLAIRRSGWQGLVRVIEVMEPGRTALIPSHPFSESLVISGQAGPGRAALEGVRRAVGLMLARQPARAIGPDERLGVQPHASHA